MSQPRTRCTPSMSRIAAAQGKHVLVEKPMAITLDECRAMIEAVRKAGVQLVVGHSHSFNAPILRTRELIDSGEFGSRAHDQRAELHRLTRSGRAGRKNSTPRRAAA